MKKSFWNQPTVRTIGASARRRHFACLLALSIVLGLLPLSPAASAEEQTTAAYLQEVNSFLASATFAHERGAYPPGFKTYLENFVSEATAQVAPEALSAKLSALLTDHPWTGNYPSAPAGYTESDLLPAAQGGFYPDGYPLPGSAFGTGAEILGVPSDTILTTADCEAILFAAQAAVEALSAPEADGAAGQASSIYGGLNQTPICYLNQRIELAQTALAYLSGNDPHINAKCRYYLERFAPSLKYNTYDILPTEFTLDTQLPYAQENWGRAFDGDPSTAFEGTDLDAQSPSNTITVQFNEPVEFGQLTIFNAPSNGPGRFMEFYVSVTLADPSGSGASFPYLKGKDRYEKQGANSWGPYYSNDFAGDITPAGFTESMTFDFPVDNIETVKVSKVTIHIVNAYYIDSVHIPEIRLRRPVAAETYGLQMLAHDSFPSGLPGLPLNLTTADEENGWASGWVGYRDPDTQTVDFGNSYPLPDTYQRENGVAGTTDGEFYMKRALTTPIRLGQGTQYLFTAEMNQKHTGAGGDKYIALNLGGRYSVSILNGYGETYDKGNPDRFVYLELNDSTTGAKPNNYQAAAENPRFSVFDESEAMRLIVMIDTAPSGQNRIKVRLSHLYDDFSPAAYEDADWDLIYEVNDQSAFDEIGVFGRSYGSGMSLYTLYISATRPESVALQETARVAPGQTIPLVPVVEPAGAVLPDIQWSADNPAVATVDASGKVTGVSEGMTRVHMSVPALGFSAQTTVVVGGSAAIAEDFSVYEEGTGIGPDTSSDAACFSDDWHTVVKKSNTVIADDTEDGGAYLIRRGEGAVHVQPDSITADDWRQTTSRRTLSAPVSLQQDGIYDFSVRLSVEDWAGVSRSEFALQTEENLSALRISVRNNGRNTSNQSTFTASFLGETVTEHYPADEAHSLESGWWTIVGKLVTRAGERPTLFLNVFTPLEQPCYDPEPQSWDYEMQGGNIANVQIVSQVEFLSFHYLNQVSPGIADIRLIKRGGVQRAVLAKAGGSPILQMQPGTAEFETLVVNDTPRPFPVQVTTGLYDAAGELLSSHVAPQQSIAPGALFSTTFTAEVPAIGCVLKSFFWDAAAPNRRLLPAEWFL